MDTDKTKIRVNTFLDKELMKRVKMLAVQEEKYVNQLIEEALKKLLESKKA